MRQASLLLFVAAALNGCFVDPGTFAGRACDDTHPCAEGRFCVEGLCANSAGPETDGGAVEQPLWTQWQAGAFDDELECNDCVLTIDPGKGNQVYVSVPNDSALSGDAVARRNGSLGAPARGKWGGRFRLLGPMPTGDLGPFFAWLLGPDRLWVVVMQLQNGALRVSSSQDTLGSDAAVYLSGPLTLGTDWHTVEVAWERNNFRTVRLDGVVVQELALTQTAVPAPEVVLVEIGAHTTSGFSAGVEMELRDWQLLPDPTMPLTLTPLP